MMRRMKQDGKHNNQIMGNNNIMIRTKQVGKNLIGSISNVRDVHNGDNINITINLYQTKEGEMMSHKTTPQKHQHEIIFEQVLKLESLKAVAKGGKFAMSTDYTKGLTTEEIADYFDGLVALVEPIIDVLHEVQNKSRETFENQTEKDL